MKLKATSLNRFNQSWFKDRRQETIMYSKCSLKFRINVLKPTDISKMKNTRKIMFQMISTRMGQYQAKTVCKQWLLENCFMFIYRCTWCPYHMPYMDRRGVLEKGCRFNNPRSAGCARADIRAAALFVWSADYTQHAPIPGPDWPWVLFHRSNCFSNENCICSVGRRGYYVPRPEALLITYVCSEMSDFLIYNSS